jgi:hypothetical protein
MIEVRMEIHDHPNKKFMAKYDRYEPVILDHTAMISAKTCKRKYFYQIVLGRVPKEDAIYFAWGSAYHKFREILERQYGYGNLKPLKFDEQLANASFVIAANAGVDYWRKHGKDQGVDDKFSWMTSPRLLKSFAVAFKHWMLEKQQGKIEILAVEQAFNIQLPDGSYRSGRADQIIKWNGKTWGRDFKTSSKDGVFYARTLDPNEQFTGYTYAEGKLTGEQIQGQIIEVLYNAKATKKEEKGPEIVVLTASRTDYQLEMWEKEHMFYKKIIDMCRSEDIWPMEEVGCSFCPYHAVCKQGSEAGMMYQLESQFNVRPWNNAEIGQDL